MLRRLCNPLFFVMILTPFLINYKYIAMIYKKRSIYLKIPYYAYYSITDISAFSSRSSAEIILTSRFIARIALVFSIP